MYKYFCELENPREFKTCLTRNSSDKKQDLSLYNISYSEDLLKELKILFPKLMVIDEMIMRLNERLLAYTSEENPLSDEAWLRNDAFFHLRENLQW